MGSSKQLLLQVAGAATALGIACILMGTEPEAAKGSYGGQPERLEWQVSGAPNPLSRNLTSVVYQWQTSWHPNDLTVMGSSE